MIKYEIGSNLESIVRNVYSCGEGGMGGIISTTHLREQPFDAALLAIAPLWRKGNYQELEQFFSEWEPQMRSPSLNDKTASDFEKALAALVSELKKKQTYL